MEKTEPIVIDANIIIGIGDHILNEYSKNKRKPLMKIIYDVLENKTDGVLVTLFENYILFTSILSKYEFMHSKERKGNMSTRRKIYDEITYHFKISQLTFEGVSNFMTYEFFENLLKYDIDLADGMHVLLASKKSAKNRGLIFVTGNTKHIPKIKKLWSKVYSVSEIYKKLKKEGKLGGNK